jgi:hypothetical protein
MVGGNTPAKLIVVNQVVDVFRKEKITFPKVPDQKE